MRELFALSFALTAGMVGISSLSLLLGPDGKGLLTRMFAAWSLTLFLWNLGYAMMALARDPELVRLAYYLSAIGWLLSPTFAFYYAYRFWLRYVPPRARLLPWWFFALPAPPFAFALLSGRLMAYDFRLGPYGWIELMDPRSPYNYLYIVYALASLAAFGYVGLALKSRAPCRRTSLHARLVTMPMLAIAVLLVAYHMVLPLMGLSNLPPFVQVPIGIWLVGFSLQLNRYPVLSAAPDVAADQIVNAMSDLCVIVDRGGLIRAVNPALKELLGYGADELTGRAAADFLPPEALAGLRSAMRGESRLVNLEANLLLSGGGSLPCRLTMATIRDSLGDAVGAVLIGRELREIKRLERLTVTDDLTGAYNRRLMDEALGAALVELRRKGAGFAVLSFDIDHFKMVNDDFGHEAGDRVLVELSRAVRTALRADDTFIRWGGEEFMVICRDSGPDDALLLAERIRTLIRGHDFGLDRAVTASFGVAWAEAYDSVESLARRADGALYRAKADGRDCCRRA